MPPPWLKFTRGIAAVGAGLASALVEKNIFTARAEARLHNFYLNLKYGNPLSDPRSSSEKIKRLHLRFFYAVHRGKPWLLC